MCVVVLSLSSLGHQVVATHKGIASSTKTQTREKKKVVMGEQKGWLLKEGPSMAWIWGRQWLRRYCTITDKDPTAIVYYTEPDAPAPKGRIDVSCVCAMKPSKAHAQTIHKNIHAHSDTQIHRCTDTETHTCTLRDTHRDTRTHRDRQAYAHTHTQTHTDRQTYAHTQTDRQTYAHRHTDRHTHTRTHEHTNTHTHTHTWYSWPVPR